ncbi:LamG-like jellyroll fold domain-containing protein [Vibrio sp. 10N.261.51.F12]|uniref:LamG-like jellyroll fold domain-containing protein n=1 Tax=Vibrio sp. 10N.261.51.F12 TaxID=3229679 RepID=UPI00354B506C
MMNKMAVVPQGITLFAIFSVFASVAQANNESYSLLQPQLLDEEQSYYIHEPNIELGNVYIFELENKNEIDAAYADVFADSERIASLKVDGDTRDYAISVNGSIEELELRVVEGKVTLSHVSNQQDLPLQNPNTAIERIELGTFELTDQWQTLYPTLQYSMPILLTSAYQVSSGDVEVTTEPNVNDSGVVERRQDAAGNWELRVKPWPGMDNFHANIDYLIIEAQEYQSESMQLLAARLNRTSSDFWQQWLFSEASQLGMNWHHLPAVVTQPQTQHDERSLFARIKQLDFSGFWSALFYPSANGTGGDTDEELGVLALSVNEDATLAILDVNMPVSMNTFSLKEAWKQMGDWEYRLTEDTTDDSEQSHTSETVNLIQIGEIQLVQTVTNNGSDNYSIERRLHSSVDYDHDGLRDEFDADKDNDGVVNADDAYPYDELRSVVAVVQVPSMIHAVDYTEGQDNDEGESNYRGADGIDIENDATAGLHISRMNEGEWLRYTIDVAQAGYYDVTFSLGSEGTSALELQVEGQRNTTLDFQSGGARNFQPFTIPTVYLPTGEQTLTVTAKHGSFRFANIEIAEHAPELSPLLKLMFEDDHDLTIDSSSYAREDVKQLGDFDQPIMRTGYGLQFAGDHTQKLVWKAGPALSDFSLSVQINQADVAEGTLSLMALSQAERGFLLLEKTQSGVLRLRSVVKDDQNNEIERSRWDIQEGTDSNGFLTITFATVENHTLYRVGDLKVYIDGEQVVDEQRVFLPRYDVSQLVLGDSSASLTQFYSIGRVQLDEWRLDGHALSAAQIASVYANSAAPDTDNDGHIDIVDAFPEDVHEWQDSDNDGLGNNADTDDDNDGAPDSTDAFPLDPTEDTDTDGNGIGNNADTDDDGDGVLDDNDAYPTDPNHSESVTLTVNVDDIGVPLTAQIIFTHGEESYPLNVQFGELKNTTLPAQKYSVYAPSVQGLQAFRTPVIVDLSDADTVPEALSLRYRPTPDVSYVNQRALPGLSIDVLKTGLGNIRQLALGDEVLYAATRTEDKVYGMPFNAATMEVGHPVVVADGLNMPSGLAYRDGALYIADVDGLYRVNDVDAHYTAFPTTETLLTLPGSELDTSDRSQAGQIHHQWKFIRFGPNPNDNSIYIPVGQPCNACSIEDERFGTILKYDLNTGEYTIAAKGIRNTVGFDFHPDTQNLWFSDNSRQATGLGSEFQGVVDELNHVTEEGQHFGAPYVYGYGQLGVSQDEEDNGEGLNIPLSDIRVENYQAPALSIAGHSAPLGIEFNNLLPASFGAQQLWIAEHGNGTPEHEGIHVQLVGMNAQGEIDYQIDAIPFMKTFGGSYICFDGSCNGRPVAFLTLADGSMLMSDDAMDSLVHIKSNEAALLDTTVTITPPDAPSNDLVNERVRVRLTDPLGYERNITLRFGGQPLVIQGAIHGDYTLKALDFTDWLSELDAPESQSLNSDNKAIAWGVDYYEVTVDSGSVTLRTPTSPSFDVVNDQQSVTITGENYQSNQNMAWNSTLVLDDLALGEYELVVSQVGAYSPVPSSQRLSVTGREPNVNATWTMSGDSTTGASLYQEKCADCHNGQGVGPDLIGDQAVADRWSDRSLTQLKSKVDTMFTMACDDLCRQKVASYLWYDVWGNKTEEVVEPGIISLALNASNNEQVTVRILGDNVEKEVVVTAGDETSIIDLPLQYYRIEVVTKTGVRAIPAGYQATLSEQAPTHTIMFELQADPDSDGDGIADSRDWDDDNDGTPDLLDESPLDNAVTNNTLIFDYGFEAESRSVNPDSPNEGNYWVYQSRNSAPNLYANQYFEPVPGAVGDGAYSYKARTLFANGLTFNLTTFLESFTFSYWMNFSYIDAGSYLGLNRCTWFCLVPNQDSSISVFDNNVEIHKSQVIDGLDGWAHIALVYDQGTFHLYVDGKSISTFVHSVDKWSLDGRLFIGNPNKGIDELKLFDAALTASQVSALRGDNDGDGVLDIDDLSSKDNTLGLDSDNDGIEDSRDLDDDNDGVVDSLDWAPTDASETLDTDGDGIGNNADNDDDNDGVLDAYDGYPLDPLLSTLPVMVDIDPNTATFADVNERLIQARCVACHTDGGAADLSQLKFEHGDDDLTVQKNADRLMDYVRDYDSDIVTVLAKPAGKVNHGGATVFPESSNQWQILRAVLYKAFNKPIETEPEETSLFHLESRDQTYRKAKLLLQGEVPTQSEMLDARSWSEEKLREEVTKLTDSSEQFKAFVIRTANDNLHTRSLLGINDYRRQDYTNDYYYWHYPESYNLISTEGSDVTYQDGIKFSRELIEAPLELIWDIVSKDKPYSEVLTADYTMGSASTAKHFADINVEEGTFVPVKDTNYHVSSDGRLPNYYGDSRERVWSENDISVDRPHSGVLSTFGYLWTYPNTDTNFHRTRANNTMKIFLNYEIETNLARTISTDDVIDDDNPTMNNPACANCHITMDPIAAGFQDYGHEGQYKYVGGKNSLIGSYRAEYIFDDNETWYRDIRPAGYYGVNLPDGEVPIKWLGERLVQDRRFATGTVNFWWPALFSRNLRKAPDPDSLEYQDELAIYEYEQRIVEDLADNFVASNMNLKLLLVDMIMHEYFRAESTTEGSISGLERYRALTPEELVNKFESVTGYSYNEDGDWGVGEHLFNDTSYRVNLGGIDSISTKTRQRDVSAIAYGLMKSQAVTSSCSIIVNEFKAQNKRLFNGISESDVPGLYSKTDVIISASDSPVNTEVRSFAGKGVNSIRLKFTEGGFIGRYLWIKNENDDVVLEGTLQELVQRGVITHNFTEHSDGESISTWSNNNTRFININIDIPSSGNYTAIIESTPKNQLDVGINVTWKQQDTRLAVGDSKDKVQAKLSELINTLWGENTSVESEEVLKAYELFAQLLDNRTLEADGRSLDSYGRCAYMSADPNANIELSDTYNTLNTWQAMLSYFLMDFRFGHE